MVYFNEKPVQALIDSKSRIKAIKPSFTKKLNLCIKKTKVGIQKIDSSKFETNKIVIISFLIDDKTKRFWFFRKTFLLANFSIDVALGILLFILNNIKINFTNYKLK